MNIERQRTSGISYYDLLLPIQTRSKHLGTHLASLIESSLIAKLRQPVPECPSFLPANRPDTETRTLTSTSILCCPRPPTRPSPAPKRCISHHLSSSSSFWWAGIVSNHNRARMFASASRAHREEPASLAGGARHRRAAAEGGVCGLPQMEFLWVGPKKSGEGVYR